MSNHNINNLNPTPAGNNSAVTKKWTEDTFVKKTKITLAEWTWSYVNVGTTYRYPTSNLSGWPVFTRSDYINGETNIEVKVATLDSEKNKAALAGMTLHFIIKCVTSDNTSEQTINMVSVDLSTKTGSELATGSGTVISVHLDEEVYLGDNATFLKAIAYVIGIKLTGTGSRSTTGPEVFVTYRINESGKYG